MRVWLDGQCLQTSSRRRGIGRYVIEFIRAIAENHPDVELLISFNAAMPQQAITARAFVSCWFKPENIHVWHGAAEGGEVPYGLSSKRRLSESFISYHVSTLKPDIAISTSPFEGMGDQSVPILPNALLDVPLASIFYDAIPFRYAEKYLVTPELERSYVRRMNAHKDFCLNLCISEFSTRELIEISGNMYSINISAGISKEFIETAKFNSKSNELRTLHPYILYIGGLDWRKNVSLIPQAISKLPHELKHRYNFVIAGDGGAQLVGGVRSQWVDNGMPEERFFPLGHVSEASLVNLYNGADLLVQPSYMEGFGLTALEAMVCGTPVIAANAGALREVVGDDRLLFDPASASSLAATMTQILSNAELRDETVKSNRERSGRFTWEKSAETAVEALRKVALSGTQPVATSSLRKRFVDGTEVADQDAATAACGFALAEKPAHLPKRLLIDVTSTARIDHKSGIQRVVTRICDAIVSGDGNNLITKLTYCDDDTGYFDCNLSLVRPAKSDPNALTLRRTDYILNLDSSWEFHTYHRRHLAAARIKGAEVVSCLFDTVPLKMPAFCTQGMQMVFHDWFRTALTYSTGFVCISRAVADELHAILKGIDFPHRMKIGYWRLGADFVDGSGTGATAATLVEASGASPKRAPTFLMVGTMEPRKGHALALEAFSALWSSGVGARLVIVGKPGWGMGSFPDRLRAHPEFGHRLFWHDRVEDAELIGLYRDCDALVAASYAEGFGLPIVEAGHFAKPVIASDIPVFREVAAGAAAADFFEVGSARALAEAVRRFIERQTNAVAEKPAASSWPTWAESARELEDVVIGGRWYITYEPREADGLAAFTDIGTVRMDSALTGAQTAHTLSLLREPSIDPASGRVDLIVALTNRSDTIWSSEGDANGDFAVSLSFHTYRRDGSVVDYDNPRTRIPFVLVPGDTAYLPIEIPRDLIDRGAVRVAVEMVQDGASWWGDTLSVDL